MVRQTGELRLLFYGVFVSLANLLEMENHYILSDTAMNFFQDNLPIKLFISTAHFFILLFSLGLSVLR